MPPIHFKLTSSDGYTRRITFENLPAWHELAARLQALYDIPLASVGVSYIDNDNDEITASSNEELQDYYQTSLKPGQAIKFKVLDLSLSPAHGHGSSTTPNANSNRNTFGPGIEDLDLSEWQRLGHFDFPAYIESVSDGPRAFVETVTSDASGFARDNADATETESEDDHSTILPVHADKGKQKASSSLGAASTTSVIEEDFSKKYPVHVFNHARPTETTTSDSQDEAPAHSTPKLPTTSVDAPVDESTPMDEDPPLPSLDSFPQSNASPDLTHDIATLLGTLTGIISSHPEFSEGIRNIVQNATNGAYWETHRAHLSQAANEFRQTTNNFEQEAAQRISDALGNFFRSFNQGNEEDRANHPPPRHPSTNRPFPWYQPPPGGRRPWGRRSMTGFGPHLPWGPFWYNQSLWAHPPRSPSPHAPPPPPGHPQQGPPPPQQGPPPPRGPPPPPGPPPPGRGFHYGLFPPPPPPPFHMFPPRFPPPPPPHGDQGNAPTPPQSPSPGNRPPPPPDNEHRPPFPPRVPSPPGSHHGHRHGRHPHGGPPPHRSSSPGGVHPPPQRGFYSNAFHSDISFLPEAGRLSSKPTEQQLRAQLEEAKRVYKAQKEAYRQGREERKNEKSSRDTQDTSTIRPEDVSLLAETSQGHIISRAWGSYPQLELYSTTTTGRAPRRHNTHPGHGHREDLNDRAQSRIARRLADMGFAENAHPELPSKIKAQLPTEKMVTKEQEDDIVTNLLEGLLAQGPKSPVASGSNAKKQGVTEVWDDL